MFRAVAFLVALTGCTHLPPGPDGAIAGRDMPARLYCVEHDHDRCIIYRSSQPSAAEFAAVVSRLGIASVLKLNGELPFDGGSDVIPDGVLVVKDQLLPAGPVTDGQLTRALDDLRELARTRPPVLIHCTHGIDRTGLLVALWRVEHGSTPFAAWREWHAYGHGAGFPMLDESFEHRTGYDP